MAKPLPPVLVLALLASMPPFHTWLPGPVLVPPPYRVLGGVPLAAGLLLLIAARAQFARRGTNIHTFREPGSMVTDGVFRLSRNPMYLGFALVLIGAAICFGTLSPLLLALIYLPVTNRWYIAFEEEMMASRFGDAYAQYRRRVRRWL